MVDCLLGLGSNVGNRAAQLDAAVRFICGHPQIEHVSTSRYHATRPVGGPTGQDSFLNAALRIRTTLDVADLFVVLQEVEQRLGRRRLERWGPRTIDIDILLYGYETVVTQDLVVPHPRMAVRRFVLAPAREVAADMRHPGTGMSIVELLDRLAQPPHYVAITGFQIEQTTNLAVTVAAVCGLHALVDPGSALMRQDETRVSREVSVETLLRVCAERRDQLESLWSEAESAPDEWHVSSFWLPDLIAVASTRIAVEFRAKLEQACELAAAQVPVPHCVIFLDPRPSGTGTETTSHAANEWAEAVAHQLSRPESPPYLHIPGAASRLALTELTAAIDAMR